MPALQSLERLDEGLCGLYCALDDFSSFVDRVINLPLGAFDRLLSFVAEALFPAHRRQAQSRSEIEQETHCASGLEHDLVTGHAQSGDQTLLRHGLDVLALRVAHLVEP